MRTVFCLVLIGLSGCSSGSQVPDGGPPDADGDQVSDDGDPGQQGSDQEGDPEAGDQEGDGDGDSGPAQIWEWCPSSSDFQGGNWAATLRVTQDALYCAAFDEARTLEDELRLKARLRLVPGDYPMPENDLEGDILFPICIEFREDGSQPSVEDLGHIQANYWEEGSVQNYSFYFKLIYNPTHHHFDRDFAVLFDSPIGSACGLKFENLGPWGPFPCRATMVECDLTEIEERELVDCSWETLE
jgi:hypothetical protein